MKELQAAIYARVSSEQQSEAQTIASQVAALRTRVAADGLALLPEREYIDEGYSGATFVRPALERMRDLVASGGLDRIYVHSPDRLARKYAYQVLLLDEFQSANVQVIFLNREIGRSPEDDLLLQVQGMVAEYERAKILERSRRGKRHAARCGKVSVLSCAPYGYRYVAKRDTGGEARLDVVLEEARVVRQIFTWVAQEKASIGEVCRRLEQAGEPTRTGKTHWDRSSVWGILKNPIYKGTAAFGKTRIGPLQPRLRPPRGGSLQPRRAYSVADVAAEEWTFIPAPALVEEAVFATVAEQLQENRKHARQRQRGARYLLQGLIVCGGCGYSYYGKAVSLKAAKGHRRDYAYYRCLGTDAYRFGGERICGATQVRTDLLDATVWQEVCSLLENPARLEQEYARRLDPQAEAEAPTLTTMEAQIGKLRQGIARLIDSYAEGLIEKDEFEPRLARLRERVARLVQTVKQLSDQASLQADIRLILGRLEDFAAQVQSGLADADWQMRRDIIRALVRRVEVNPEQVQIVFRVGPDPFVLGPQRATLQDCRRGHDPALWCTFLGIVEYALFHVARFQPFMEDGLIHRDVRQQPFVVDFVEAG